MNKLAIANPFAGIQVPTTGGAINVNTATIGDIITAILPYIFSAAALIMLVYFVLAGLQLMTSRGEPKVIQMAQAKITTSLIGFAIIFLAYGVVKLSGQIFNLPVFIQIFK